MKDIKAYLRKNILELKPYSSARDEYQGGEAVFLDANENPYREKYNRYPDPLQRKLKDRISEIKGVPAGNIFLGNGSDEPIDIVIRAFCDPGKDNLVAIDPTYGMYVVAADINNVEYRKVRLNDDFSLDASKVLQACDSNTKIIFLCSPNNPTGNLLDRNEIVRIVEAFNGIVVIDEAYIDFAEAKSFIDDLPNYPNLVILHTLSKAWGLAAVRLGMAFADKYIISVFNKIKYPYNINQLTQEYVYESLQLIEKKEKWVKQINQNRLSLMNELKALSLVKNIYPSDSNFFLIKVDEPNKVYDYLVDNKIIVRNRTNIALCEGCLRITVGTEIENKSLIESLKKYK